MPISQEDIQQVLNAIKAESQGVQELEEVTSLNGVTLLQKQQMHQHKKPKQPLFRLNK